MVVIACVLLVPILSRKVNFPRTDLAGMENRYRLPNWSLKQFKKEKFQKGVERWALRGNPLWGWSVRLANQLVYTLTGEVSLDYHTTVQGGREGYLWQPMYLRSVNRNEPAPRDKIYQTFRDLKKAQTLLAEHHIPLVAVINPNLVALYPELLPEKYVAVRSHEASYAVAKEAMKQFEPKVIDTFVALQELQPKFPFRFFSPTGSHWNDIGSCLAARTVSSELARGWGEREPVFECEKWQMEDSPRTPELDLVHVANFIAPERLSTSTPYLVNHPQAQFRKPKKILLIGTSFLFGLEQQLLEHGVADSTLLLFYFRSARRDGKGGFGHFDPRKLTKEALLSYDAVIVDANVAGPGIMGYGSLRLINSHLQGTPLEDEVKPSPKKRGKKKK